MMGIIASISLGIITNLIYDTGKYGIKELTSDNRSDYEKELSSIIQSVIDEHKEEFDTEDKPDGKFSFVKSQKILKILLNFHINGDLSEEKIVEAFNGESMVYSPSNKEIGFFLLRFRKKIDSSEKFKKLYYNENYKKEIFKISNAIDELKENNFKSVTESIRKVLHSEYKSSIEDIQSCIDDYKMRTALNLIQTLRQRIERASLLDIFFKSKLLFLEAICERELQSKSNRDYSLKIIKAYNLDKDDITLQLNACLSFFNVNDNDEALFLANQIIEKDKYQHIPWLIKVFVASNSIEEFECIPTLLKSDELFINSLFFNSIILQNDILYGALLSKGFKVNYEFEIKAKLTLKDKSRLFINIHLLIDIIMSFKVLDLKGALYLKNFENEIDILFKNLEYYIKKLKGTEIEETINLEKYYYNFIKFLYINNDQNFSDLSNSFSLIDNSWTVTFTFYQALQALDKIEESNELLDNYKNNTNNIIYKEWFIIKAINLNQLKRKKELKDLYINYLDIIEIINENNLMNVINMFADCLVGNEFIDNQESLLQLTLNKKTENETIKRILKVYIRTHLLKEKNEQLIKEALTLIHYQPEKEGQIYCIAESLIALELLIEARNFLKDKININTENQLLRFYIELLNEIVRDKNIHENDIHNELLDLLKKWRLFQGSKDYKLLCYEFELLNIINDDSMLEVGESLIINFPEIEWSHYIYVYSLKQLYGQDFDLIHEVKEDYENEKIGLQIFTILKDNSDYKALAFKIIFNLSKKDNNKDSRTIYFTNSMLFSGEFFQRYSEVQENKYVLFEQDGQQTRRKVSSNDSLLGKEIGSEFKVQNSLGKELFIKVLEVYGEELNLFYEILNESEDQTSGLGLISMYFPTESLEKMNEFLIENFGKLGTQQKEFSEERIREYLNFETGFLEITRSIFKENFIDSYYSLTSSEKFTILPSCLISPKVDTDNPKFVLDKSSLMLFFELTKEASFSFSQKFYISKLITKRIQARIIALKSNTQPKLSTIITNDEVDVIRYADNYNEQKIEVYSNILKWINENCEEVVVEEKIDVVLKFDDHHVNDDYFQCLIETVMLANRDNHFLITDDIFMYRFMKNIRPYILNSEHFIEKYYSSYIDNDFYKFLMDRNYMGIKISKDVLTNEFLNKLLGNSNYYSLVLENLSYKLDNRLEKNTLISEVIREIYLMQGISLENQAIYSFEILSQALIGAPKEYRKDMYKKLDMKFKLLGSKYKEILNLCGLIERQLAKAN
ncbi:MAG: hypothetical protein N4A45_06860 [Flavobacteriales bacterium]|jgi:hypothetical protein|nr:hypothetical protein [Flavobacteriales bacterium]